MSGRRLFLSIVTTVLAFAQPVAGQDDTQTDSVDRQLADLYAIVVSTQATTRCAVYDDTLRYLSPLEAAAVEYRFRQMESTLAASVDNIADVVANMRGEAMQISCGAPELNSFLEFSRTLARDLVDVALLAWRDIEIARCSYFADDGFMASAARAGDIAEDIEITGAPGRIQYIERTAAGWVERFEANCSNLSFDPTRTLPGLVALALPSET